MIELGSNVRDSITGFTGMVTGRIEWLEGWAHVLIQSTEGEFGAESRQAWVPEPRIVLV